MKTIIVDDEPFAIDALAYILERFDTVEVIGTFKNAETALAFVKTTPPEIAFLDIEIPGIGGIALARALKTAYPDLKIVFATGYNNYAEEAFDVRATGYILKPFSEESVAEVLARIENETPKEKEPPIVIRTFGRFDIFVKGTPVLFRNKKAKELVALCVDHYGGQVSMEEAIDKLWEDRTYDEKTKKLYRKAVMAATHTLAEAGVENLFKTGRGLCYLNRENVICDYYQVIEKQTKDLSYQGEYLFDYDWAEERIGEIEKAMEKK
ncbi:MAG: response regulator [Eubacterium sp.]